jgi:hypothetical protein
MPCPYHRGLCAYPDWRADRCEFCHASWDKITRPAARYTERATRAKDGTAITVTDIAYLDGYGETPLSHMWQHAKDIYAAEAEKARYRDRRAARNAE